MSKPSTEAGNAPDPTTDLSKIPEEHRILVEVDADVNKETGEIKFTPKYADKRTSRLPTHEELSAQCPSGLTATVLPSNGQTPPEFANARNAGTITERDGQLVLIPTADSRFGQEEVVLGPARPGTWMPAQLAPTSSTLPKESPNGETKNDVIKRCEMDRQTER